jgi:hypothetical protein
MAAGKRGRRMVPQKQANFSSARLSAASDSRVAYSGPSARPQTQKGSEGPSRAGVAGATIVRFQRNLGNQQACTNCGRTKDMWEENNGQGIRKAGRPYCCKPCSAGDDCICADMDSRKGMELGGLVRGVRKRR